MDALTLDPAHEAFARSVWRTLAEPRKSIEPRWLYDAVGAKLFEAITQLDHYYPTRTELALIASAASEIAATLGPGTTLVEPGSGEGLKVRPLLDAFGRDAAGYVPIDIADDQLAALGSELAGRYPHLTVRPVAADFFQPFTMPQVERPVVFFPGSTIGNMSPAVGQSLLDDLLTSSGAERLLIGFDLLKDRARLLDAYDDPAGVTAAFALNVLQRINRELDATFDLRAFAYRASFQDARSAVEMGLVSRADQVVKVAGRAFAFEEGEFVHTEDSRKFTVESFAAFAEGASLTPVRTWADPANDFALMLLARS